MGSLFSTFGGVIKKKKTLLNFIDKIEDLVVSYIFK